MIQAAARAGVMPAAFWALSLKEWRMLTMAAEGSAPMGRGDFERLVGMWPD